MEPPRDRPAVLNGWKEIAGYLGKSVRTVQRWERDLGLPVYRVSDDSSYSVYARSTELDGWIAQSRAADDSEPTPVPAADSAPVSSNQPVPPPVPRFAVRREALVLLTVAASIALLIAMSLPYVNSREAVSAPDGAARPSAARPASYMVAAVRDVILMIDPARAAVVQTFVAPAGSDFIYTAGTRSSDGVYLVLTTETPGVVLFNLETRRFEKHLRLPDGLRIVKARLTNDGLSVLAVEQLGRVFLMDAATGARRAEIAVPRETFDAASNRADTRYFIPSRDGRIIAVINAASHAVERRIDSSKGAHDIVTTRDSTRGFVSNEYAGTLTCLDVEAGLPIGEARLGSHPISLAISADDETVYASNRDDGSISVVDVARCRVRRTIVNAAAGGRVGVLDVSQDGRTLLVSGFDGGGIFALDVSGDRASPIGRIPTIAEARAIVRGPAPPAIRAPAANAAATAPAASRGRARWRPRP